ncbi:MAG: Tex-like N-terminal domain-containing protein, partial [Bacillota bacterium]
MDLDQILIDANTSEAAHITQVADELNIPRDRVEATAKLLGEGATVPFIARYRKEATGSLDEVAITAIRDRLAQLAELRDRRNAILKSLIERDLLTPELHEQVLAAKTMAELEDVYLPYRPKRRTRATIAKEKGLEPLADLILAQEIADPEHEALAFVDPEKGVESASDAIAGASDIIAERISEDQETRGAMRKLYQAASTLRSRAVSGKETEGAKYQDYFEWEEPVYK